MSNLKIFCVTNKKISHLEGSSLLLASVGKEKFNKNYLKSNIQDNIFYKEKYYSELTFHYWYWKNLIQQEKAEWVGFCQRRRIWLKNSSSKEFINKQNIKNHILDFPDPSWSGYDSILCGEIKTSGNRAPNIIRTTPPKKVVITPAGVNLFQNTPIKIATTKGGVKVE